MRTLAPDDFVIVNNDFFGGHYAITPYLDTFVPGSPLPSTGIFQSGGGPQNYATDANPIAIAAADFNGDGHPDAVVGCYTNPNDSNPQNAQLDVFLGDGKGAFAPSAQLMPLMPFVPNTIAVGDFNKDGKPDIAVGASNNSNGDKLYILTNTSR